jgi:hypothetical protein
MVRFRSLSIIAYAVFVFSCGNDLPELKGIDKSEWIADKHACGDKRSKMVTSLQTEKDKLLALSEMEIVEVLGRPDENELYKRNQKFYYYHLNPGKEFCDTASDTTVLKLVIRFNAMGLAKEISIE